MLRVRCCPEPADGLPRERRDGPEAEQPVDRASGMENAREQGCNRTASRQRVFHPAVDVASDAHTAHRRSSLLISIHDDQNRQK